MKGKYKVTYQEAKDYLEQTSKTGMIFGLDTIRNLLEELGNPQDELKFVHLAGTNGKGSVLSYTASILIQAGYRTGQYTSPALISKREQIQMNGEWITKEYFAKLVMEVKEAVSRLRDKEKSLPTVYEVETAMAFLYFKKEKCDIVVLETGMGGRDDATNIVKNTLVAGFTSISLDHMSFLGETIEEIATVKAGIIKPHCRVVSGIQKPSVLDIVESTFLAVQSEVIDRVPSLKIDCGEDSSQVDNTSQLGKEPLLFRSVCEEDIRILEETYKGQSFTYKDSEPYTIQMIGRHQVENAAIALEIIAELQELGFEISEANIKSGLAKTKFFGRFTLVGEKPIFIVDGAHNENGVLRLRENITGLFPNQKMTFIMGIYKDKMVGKIVETILPLAEAVVTVSLFNEERTITGEELKRICERTLNHRDLEITACTSIKEAVELAIGNAGEDGVVIAFGSLSYLWTAANLYTEIKVEIERSTKNGS